MKTSKQARREGKAYFRACFDGPCLNENKVRETVKSVLQTKPRSYLSILSHFQRLLKLHLDSRRARVENAVESPQELLTNLRTALERRYGPGLDLTYWINPALLGGIKIRVGSDVYDGSIQARLEALKTSF